MHDKTWLEYRVVHSKVPLPQLSSRQCWGELGGGDGGSYKQL